MTLDARTPIQRRELARDLFRQRAPESDWLLVTALDNVRYLTGFRSSNAILALHASDPGLDLLGTDGRYAAQVVAESADLPVVIDRDTLGAMVGRLGGDAATVCVEASMDVHQHQRLCRDLAIEVTTVPGVVESLRVVKDAAELAALERACRITAEALMGLLDEVTTGMTEILLARRLEQLFGELGADDRAFPTIVASGPNSAIPHHRCSRRPLEPGDLVVIDAGAMVDGYHADMTRTIIIASHPQPWQARIHEVVARAQALSQAGARCGVSLAELDACAREPITQAGYADAYVHGLGHGVGLAIHEAPFITARATDTLAPGTPITIEPGIYLRGRGGVRIEDTIVVESAGTRVLTHMPRDLAVIG